MCICLFVFLVSISIFICIFKIASVITKINHFNSVLLFIKLISFILFRNVQLFSANCWSVLYVDSNVYVPSKMLACYLIIFFDIRHSLLLQIFCIFYAFMFFFECLLHHTVCFVIFCSMLHLFVVFFKWRYSFAN